MLKATVGVQAGFAVVSQQGSKRSVIYWAWTLHPSHHSTIVHKETYRNSQPNSTNKLGFPTHNQQITDTSLQRQTDTESADAVRFIAGKTIYNTSSQELEQWQHELQVEVVFFCLWGRAWGCMLCFFKCILFLI